MIRRPLRSSRVRKSWIAASIAAAVLSMAPFALAGEIVNETGGVQFWLPDDWEQETHDELLVVEHPSGTVTIGFELVGAEYLDAELAGLLEFLQEVLPGMELEGGFEEADFNGLEGAFRAISGTVDSVPIEVWIGMIVTPSGQFMLFYGIAEATAYDENRAVIERIFNSMGPAGDRAAPDGDSGRFIVRYEPGTDGSSRQMASFLSGRGDFGAMASTLGELLLLPHDISAVFRNCGEANAYYDPSTRVVGLCYELFVWFDKLFSVAGTLSEEEIAESVVGVGLFVFLHEVGHALIDILDIPTTGKEEDAVDDLAAVLLIESGAGAAAESAMGWFALETMTMDVDAGFSFWDEHSLDPQRMFNIMCLLFGSDPESYSGLVTDDLLPESRAVRCRAEYEEKATNWERLLFEHFRL